MCRRAGLNHHDVWSLHGVGLPADRLPMILGCDGAGVDADGNEVIIHAVVATAGWSGDETLDPGRTLLSELYDGTLARAGRGAGPQRRAQAGRYAVGDRPRACRRRGSRHTGCSSSTRGSTPGATVLVQGAGGGVATALVQLGAAAGYRMWVTSRDEAKAAKALEVGADRGVRRPGSGCPSGSTRSWRRSGRRPGRTRSARSSPAAPSSSPAPRRGTPRRKAELTKIFFRQLRVIGSTMGTRAELERLAQFVTHRGIEPIIDSVLPLAEARTGIGKLAAGDVFGKIVLEVS